MSEERFDRLETMMADLMRMVGSNNSSMEQLRSDVKALTGRVDAIEQRLASLTEKVYSLDAKVDALDARVDRNHKELLDRFDRVETQIDILSARSVRHEAEIQVLKKVK